VYTISENARWFSL